MKVHETAQSKSIAGVNMRYDVCRSVKARPGYYSTSAASRRNSVSDLWQTEAQRAQQALHAPPPWPVSVAAASPAMLKGGTQLSINQNIHRELRWERKFPEQSGECGLGVNCPIGASRWQTQSVACNTLSFKLEPA